MWENVARTRRPDEPAGRPDPALGPIQSGVGPAGRYLPVERRPPM